MTVAELIAVLQQLPQDARVIVSGYEGGYHDVGGADPERIILNVNAQGYYGPHDTAPEGDDRAEIAYEIFGLSRPGSASQAASSPPAP
jgi:hypothetical protein